MSYATLDELRSQLGAAPKTPATEAYAAKQIHQVPDVEVVDRTVFLVQKVAGKKVLEFGASGPMHDGIVKAASSVFGVDRQAAPGVKAFDLDAIIAFGSKVGPPLPGQVWNTTTMQFDPLPFDIIICGELLEHLSNPGWFLARVKLQYPGVPMVITVPNAYSSAGSRAIAKGIENVNRDHVAWYSWHTLKTLVERHGFTIQEFCWYHGEPRTSEGLIMVVS